MTCNCEYCERLRYFKELGMSEDVMNYIMDLEMDVEYYKAILTGSWPSGEMVLKEALKRYEK